VNLREQQARLADRRRQQMIVYRAKGWTLDRIAAKYGLSRQRVHQILREGRS
jgi:DNA-directed RNA polymerase sigma subunit (sigma70/sigma32)